MISVSVVIPCYNRAGTIRDAINSVYSQTRAPLELIVVDDASTDDSADVAERAGATVIRRPRNAGNAAARNVGIHAASGDAIAWLDSDDYWEPQHLSIVAALLDAYPEAGVASAAIRLFGTRSEVWYDKPPDEAPRSMLRRAFYSTPIAMITAVVRRDALLAVGGFDESERWAEDFDLWLRLAHRYSFVASREITANYRWHPAQLSAAPVRQWEATYRVRKRFLDAIRETGDKATSSDLSNIFRLRWEEDVQGAWDSDGIEWLRRLVQLGGLVPDLDPSLKRKWTLRSRIPKPALHFIRALRARRATASSHGPL